MFSSRVPLPALVQWCRALRHGLHAGLSPVKILRQQAKSGPEAVRPLAGRLSDSMKDGHSFGDSLKEHRAKFPKLFTEMVAVAESSGKLAEVFEELERYFEAQQDARRRFLQALMWPGFVYVSAVLVIAILTTILAMLSDDPKTRIDPFGLGKFGPAGGLIVAFIGFGFAAVVTFLYLIGRDNDDLKQKVEAVGIRIPGLQGAYRSFALYRFSLALSMTHEAGMRADKAVFSSFQATANNAYIKHAEPTAETVRKGKKIAKALAAVGGPLFPGEFLDQVSVGETTGRLSEVMGRAAEQYREEGLRRIKLLAMICGGVVYALIGILLVVLIIRLFMVAYIDPLNQAIKDAGG